MWGPSGAPPTPLGADGLLLVNGCADPYGPKTVRASMGACFRLPVWGDRAGGVVRPAGAVRPVAVRHRSAGRYRLPERANLGRCAVIIGSEGRGSPRACWNAAARPSASPCGAAVNPSTRPRRHPSSCGRWFARAGWRNKTARPGSGSRTRRAFSAGVCRPPRSAGRRSG